MIWLKAIPLYSDSYWAQMNEPLVKGDEKPQDHDNHAKITK